MKTQAVDVICEHTRDKQVIPLKIRLIDEDGAVQTFRVKGYKCLSGSGEQVILPSEVSVSSAILSYECKIVVFEREKIIKLEYSMYEREWKVYY